MFDALMYQNEVKPYHLSGLLYCLLKPHHTLGILNLNQAKDSLPNTWQKAVE